MQFARSFPQGDLAMNLVEIFVSVDDFCKIFIPKWRQRLISNSEIKRNRQNRMSPSKTITLLICFHQSRFRDFKAFYFCHVSKQLKNEFPRL